MILECLSLFIVCRIMSSIYLCNVDSQETAGICWNCCQTFDRFPLSVVKCLISLHTVAYWCQDQQPNPRNAQRYTEGIGFASRSVTIFFLFWMLGRDDPRSSTRQDLWDSLTCRHSYCIGSRHWRLRETKDPDNLCLCDRHPRAHRKYWGGVWGIASKNPPLRPAQSTVLVKKCQEFKNDFALRQVWCYLPLQCFCWKPG